MARQGCWRLHQLGQAVVLLLGLQQELAQALHGEGGLAGEGCQLCLQAGPQLRKGLAAWQGHRRPDLRHHNPSVSPKTARPASLSFWTA